MRVIAILVASIFTSMAYGQGADEPRKILARAVEAHGGEAAILKLRTAQVSYSMWTGLPGIEMNCKVEETYQLPKQMKKTTKGRINGNDVVFVWVVNGDKYWYRENQEKTVRVEQAPDLEKGYRPFLVVENLIYGQNKNLELLVLGEKRVNGRVFVGVRAKEPLSTDLFFDKETGLLAQTTHKRLLPKADGQKDDKETIQEVSVSELKIVHGVKLPHLMTTLSNGKKTAEVRVTDVKVFEKLDDSLFAEP